jgi:Uma2 family endonuclease
MTTQAIAAPITVAPRRRKPTFIEYLAFEEKAEMRHEFINGEIIEMAGTTDYHNLLCGNIYILLRMLLKGTAGKVFMENVKVQIKDKKDYTYPDIFVTNDERDVANIRIKQYPILIIEVLSPGTRAYDKAEKFVRYKNIASLQYYMTVETEKMIVDCFSKDAKGKWSATVFSLPEEIIPLPILGIDLPMSTIYEP